MIQYKKDSINTRVCVYLSASYTMQNVEDGEVQFTGAAEQCV